MSISSGTLNSVSIASTTATLNYTPPAVEAAYQLDQVLYKKTGHSLWTVGATNVGTLGVAGNISQTGLFADTLYDFCVVTADSSDRYSLPSNIKTTSGATIISEINSYIDNMITLLSNSSNFQTWTSQNTAELAQARIHRIDLNAVNDSLYFPCAVVDSDNDENTEIDTNSFLSSAILKVKFLAEVSTDPEVDMRVLTKEFMANVGKIVQDLQSLQGVNTYLAIKKIATPNVPMFAGITDNSQGETQELITITLTITAGH